MQAPNEDAAMTRQPQCRSLLSTARLAMVTALALSSCAQRDEAPTAASAEVAGASADKSAKKDDRKAEESRREVAPVDSPMPIFADKETEGAHADGIAKDDEQLEGKEKVDETRQATEFFTHYGVGPTIDTREDPFSTFGVDVDTASYTVARSYLERQQLPPEAAVRVEEVVNYFDYQYAPPTTEDFSMHAEVVPSPQRQGYHLLHLGLKGKEVAAEERPDANLVFVIDVSGSMGSEGRLSLVQDSLRLLVNQLRASDRVAVVVYGSTARTLLPSTPGSQRQAIMAAIDQLQTEGSTNVEAGLRLGYQLAEKQARGAGINRVVLCSDGVANTGATSAQAILRRVAEHAEQGITITTIGVGMGDYNDAFMEQLADEGNGNYAYVDDEDEAERIFVDHLTGTLQVIAKDVKLQLEFDPAAVARYRLLGYENRALSRQDFDDDRKDAGELGAGHTVTALYEIKIQPGDHEKLGTLRVRYKAPRAETSSKLERDLPMSLVRSSWSEAAAPTQLSVVAAGYAEKLRGSYWARNLSWEQIQGLYGEIDPDLRGQETVRELGELIDAATRLDQRPDKFERDLPVATMDFDRVPVLQ